MESRGEGRVIASTIHGDSRLFLALKEIARTLPAICFGIALLWLNLNFPGIGNAQVEEVGAGAEVQNDGVAPAEPAPEVAKDRAPARSTTPPAGATGRRARTIGDLSNSLSGAIPERSSDTVAEGVKSESFVARYLRTLGLLVLIIGATVVAAYWIRRRVKVPRRADGSRLVEILSRTVISPKQQLLVVRVGEQALLLGVSPERFDKLLKFDEPQEVIALSGSAMSRSGSFADNLSEEEGRFDDSESTVPTLGKTPNPNLEPYRHEIERLKAMVGNWRMSNAKEEARS